MCRFLLIKSKKNFNPKPVLNQFADMCRDSRTQEGDWQGDGWGVSWLDNRGAWQLRKSLSPIWEEYDSFSEIPSTNLLVAHARSASFKKHKANIEFNQPYIDKNFCFVFNGFLKGVRVKEKTLGEIGAQKIWFLLKSRLVGEKPEGALADLQATIVKNTREIVGFNIGLVTSDSAHFLSEGKSDYFTLRKNIAENFKIIASEEFGKNEFEKMPKGRVISL